MKIAPPSTTCKIYELAHSFASFIQPDLSTSAQRAIWDALKLDDCNTTTPPPPKHKTDSLQASPLPYEAPRDSATLFVSPSGSDTAAGTITAPLKTLQAAQTKARTLTGPVTILLRGGTYYLGTTLALTAADSGLTIQSYQGEIAEVSGAAGLGELKWEPYHITKEPTVEVSMLPEVNAVGGCVQNGSNSCYRYHGKTESAEVCAEVCKSDARCSAFTWHDGEQPKGSFYRADNQHTHLGSLSCRVLFLGSESWDRQCYLVNTGCPLSTYSESHHVSGVKTVSPPQNIYMAKVTLRPVGAHFFHFIFLF